MSKKPRKSKPENKQNNVRLPLAYREKVHQFAKARQRTDGFGRVDLYRVFMEALDEFFRTHDPNTGYKFTTAPEHAESPTSIVIMPGVFESPTDAAPFSHMLDLNQFTDDRMLFLIMDLLFVMCWAAAPDCECLHASRLLVEFTGVPLAEWRGNGWAGAIHPEDREGVIKKRMESFPTRTPFVSTYRLRCVSGYYAWVVDTVDPRWRPDGSFAGYVGTIYQTAIDRPSATGLLKGTSFAAPRRTLRSA